MILSIMSLVTAAHATEHFVEVTDTAFTPASIEVALGDTVTWVFFGTVAQSSTAAAGQLDDWDSGLLVPFTFWSRDFTTVGTFTYYDQTFGSDDGGGLVSGVSGTVVVSGDSDGDGLADSEELALGTDLADADTDDDTLSDGDEVLIYGTDPLLADTDGDTLLDSDEIDTQGTDPLLADTDGGSVDDADEIDAGTDPLIGSDDLPPTTLSLTVGPVSGGANTFTADNLPPGTQARLYIARQLGSDPVALCAPLTFDLKVRSEVASEVVAADGVATFVLDAPVVAAGTNRSFQLAQHDICKISDRLDVTW